MRILDTSEVRASEIDGLGHMNVRFYMERALRANRGLMNGFGLGPDACERRGARLVQLDTYCRYHREQFQGATLTVSGGVAEAGEARLTLFYDVANPEKAEVAASFIIVVALMDRATAQALPLPPGVLDAARATRVDVPEHGRPRTIDLAPPRMDLRLSDVARRLADDASDPMSQRLEWRVDAARCDEHGFLADGQDMMFGGWGRPRAAPSDSHGPMTFVGGEGHRLGWASLETRMVRVAQPRAGDVLCSIGAEIGLHPKVRHSRRWIFDAATGALVSLNDNVSIALDLDARRSIAIPSEVRAQLAGRHLPELA
ncbi:MAG TPA: thioesterase family protein [Caulobacteraceae bacterium]|nr:thioesterase family protein [Caulobacteraceae bacterium]